MRSHRRATESKVVQVDNDPIVLAQAGGPLASTTSDGVVSALMWAGSAEYINAYGRSAASRSSKP